MKHEIFIFEKCIKIQTWKKSSIFSLYNILSDQWLKYIEMIFFFRVLKLFNLNKLWIKQIFKLIIYICEFQLIEEYSKILCEAWCKCTVVSLSNDFFFGLKLFFHYVTYSVWFFNLLTFGLWHCISGDI